MLMARERYSSAGEMLASYTYHEDGLGSTMAMSDYTGSVTDKYSYDEWGAAAHTYGSTSDNPYQYVGRLGYYTHYQEPDFPLLQLGARYYDRGIGRFTQRDTYRSRLNKYANAKGNHISKKLSTKEQQRYYQKCLSNCVQNHEVSERMDTGYAGTIVGTAVGIATGVCVSRFAGTRIGSATTTVVSGVLSSWLSNELKVACAEDVCSQYCNIVEDKYGIAEFNQNGFIHWLMVLYPDTGEYPCAESKPVGNPKPMKPVETIGLPPDWGWMPYDPTNPRRIH